MAFRFLLFCVLCPFCFGPSKAVAQAPVASSPPASSAVDENVAPGLRVLDLIALDKGGRPVADLKPEELRLVENNVEQKIQSLSPAAREPLTIGLFFDISGSRRADMFVRDETRLASEFLHSIWHEGDTGFVLAFNDEMHALVPPTNKLEAIDIGLREVPGTRRWSSTALYDALCKITPKTLTAISGRKLYVVFSDFEDNSSRNNSERALDVTREGGVAIFPVILSEGFGGGHSKKQEKQSRERAHRFAEETGGEVLVPESQQQLALIFQRLTADLQSAYRISYLPTSPSSQGTGKRGKRKLQTTRAGVTLLYPKS
jgi:VWFA-related protein